MAGIWLPRMTQRQIHMWFNAWWKAQGKKPWADPTQIKPDAPHFRQAARWIAAGRKSWEMARADVRAMIEDGIRTGRFVWWNGKLYERARLPHHARKSLPHVK